MLVFCQDKALVLSKMTNEDKVVVVKGSDLRKADLGCALSEIVAKMTRLGAHGYGVCGTELVDDVLLV